jgi:hypothetical protein
MHPVSGHSFVNCYAGDFNGDGRDDLLVHNGNSIMLFRSNGSQLDLVFSAVERVPGSWQFQPGDRFFIGDFNNDGKDEVVVFNSTNWVMEYLGLLVDDGNGGLKLIARYDDAMPGWQFQANDRFHVADFDGDGKKDLYVFNGNNWAREDVVEVSVTLPEGATDTSGGSSSGRRPTSWPAVTRSASIIWFSRIQVSS